MAFKREKPNQRNVGIWAGGRKIKTYYELTKGTYGEEEKARLKAGIKHIQNLTNKRIRKLVKFEKETGYTSPALAYLREKGLEGGISVRGSLDDLRKQYKNVLDFLRKDTSTIGGTKAHIKSMSDLLKKEGWKPKKQTGGEETKSPFPDEEGQYITEVDLSSGTLEQEQEEQEVFEDRELTPEEYDKMKELEKYFFKETSKNAIYKASNGSVPREKLRKIVNQEVVKLLSKGNLDSVLKRAKDRIDQIDEKGEF